MIPTAQNAEIRMTNTSSKRWSLRTLPAWMVSLAVHALLMVCLVFGFDRPGKGSGSGASAQSLTLLASFEQEGGSDLEQREAIVVTPALDEVSTQSADETAAAPEQPGTSHAVDETPPADEPIASAMPEDTEQVQIVPETVVKIRGLTPPARLITEPARSAPTPHWKTRLAALTAGIPAGGNDSSASDAGGEPSDEIPGGDGRPGSADGTSFFQIAASGGVFCYVVDCSSSMEEDDAIGVARRELLASLDRLEASRQFQILFYDAEPRPLASGKRTTFFATPANRKLARQFVLGQQTSGGTRHLPALVTALRSQADVVYFLTDGATPELSARDLDELRKLNRQRRPIHVIEFGRGAKLGKNWLDDLASDHRGTYRYRDLIEQ